MERKIGETFEYKGKKLQVREGENCSCHDCFFDRRCTLPVIKMAGECAANCREDNKGVVFVEVQEQTQELNLCEVLKYCPYGEPFWSPLFGYVKLHKINHEAKKVVVISNIKMPWDINNDGTMLIYGVVSSEIMLYPSREQRDWSKVKYEPRKERFDPKTLKAFDKVLARDSDEYEWKIEIYSHKNNNNNYPYKCITYSYKHCIPYNDETKHLVGTTDEAPNFYRYWED